jgi:hypothetical protein
MVTLTRSEAKAAFDHVLNEVLGRNDTSNLKRGLLAEGIVEIFDLSSLDDGFIDDLEYPDPKYPDLTNCMKCNQMLVKCFLAYMEHIEKSGLSGDYISITQASFDQVRISPANKASLQSQPLVPTSTQRNHQHLHLMIHQPPNCFTARSKPIQLSFLS